VTQGGARRLACPGLVSAPLSGLSGERNGSSRSQRARSPTVSKKIGVMADARRVVPQDREVQLGASFNDRHRLALERISITSGSLSLHFFGDGGEEFQGSLKIVGVDAHFSHPVSINRFHATSICCLGNESRFRSFHECTSSVASSGFLAGDGSCLATQCTLPNNSNP